MRAFASAAPTEPSLSTLQRTLARTRRLGSGDPLFAEIADFQTDEAQLLDEDRTRDWLELLAPDVFYWMPIRQTVLRRQPTGFDPRMAYLYETYASLEMRIGRSGYDTAYSEDPPSRTRRFISNLIVHATAEANVYAADSSFLLLRDRGDDGAPDLLSGRREDLVSRSDAGWKLSQRTILVDQTVLNMPNMGVLI